MKIFLFFTVLILGFFAAITAAVRPDIVEAKYLELRAPIDKYVAEKQHKIWEEAKKSERAVWMAKLQLPADCTAPASSLRELECKNLVDQHRQVFAQTWNNKIKSGWKPEGVEN